jgi:large subunit ribosomal protein L31
MVPKIFISMKKDIHPKYNTEAKVVCACGNSFVTGSIMDEIKTELCSACHPFYTGKQKLVDSAHRVEKFHKKVAVKTELSKERKGKTAKRAAKAATAKSKTESSAKTKKTETAKKKTDKK